MLVPQHLFEADARASAMRGLIIPHAAEVYSGHIAESGLKNALDHDFDRVILLGANHKSPDNGFYRGYAQFRRFVEPPSGLPKLNDHSVEWISRLVNKYTDAPVLAMVVGSSDDRVRRVVETYKTPRALVIASSDLSHYMSSQEARRVDGKTIREILSRGSELEACGAEAIKLLAGAVSEDPFLVAYGNSGERTGDWSSVVGYAAIQFGGESQQLRRAEEALKSLLRGEPLSARSSKKAVFITITQAGELQGCTGQTRPEFPLEEAVARAFQTTLQDERYKRDSLKDSELRISLLSELRPTTMDEVMIGRDGLVVESSEGSAIFLPEVPVEQRWGKDRYLQELFEKAGLAQGARSRLFRFTTESITLLTELV